MIHDAARPLPLTATAVAMGYDSRLLMRAVGLTLKPGEAAILRGPNGAGKTTFLRGLAGLTPLIAGKVTIADIDRREDSVAAAAKLLYIGHRDALAMELTGHEALRLWVESRGITPIRECLDAAFDAMAIGAAAQQPVRTLSAGQRRRVAMARLAYLNLAGLTDMTPLWLLDEPTTAMDSDATAAFSRLIEDHLYADGAALITSHLELPIKGARATTLAELEA